MHPINNDLREFRKQLEKGTIQNAYKALLSYMMGLRTHFKNNDYAVSGLYQGYMDMTYFALFPSSLKQRNLKIAIVFNYASFGFEVWLSGGNRRVQRQYWELFKESQWSSYRVVPQGTWVDSILEYEVVGEFDLSEAGSLTSVIEAATVRFIDDIESYLSAHESPEAVKV